MTVSSVAISGRIVVARREIILAVAYFLPGKHFRQALPGQHSEVFQSCYSAAGKIGIPLAAYAHAPLWPLLDAGISIYEYRHGYLHAKVAVIDSAWSTVGSSNTDPFSLLLAREANVVISDQVFAAELRSSLQQALRSLTRYRCIPESCSRIKRSLNWMCYYHFAILQGLLGYRRE
ncbi:MAG: phospholipase D-like domain-containing protein [Nitrosomonas sp.]|nr:phospholipase D-like domain-containing protein [Nitrosomonas sp.]